MKDLKHTKEKWIIDARSKMIKDKAGNPICTVWSSYNSDEHEQRNDDESWLSMRRRTAPIREKCQEITDANRKLIASAPYLLEALKEIKSMCDGNKDNENNIWHKASNAINKATT